MKSHIGSIIFFTILIFISISNAAIKQYPEWFLYPQKYPDIIVGYSYRGMSSEEVAQNMYCAYKRCYAVGTLEIFDLDGNRDLLKNSNYYYEFSKDSIAAIKGRLVEIDRFNVNVFSGDYISAFSLDDTLEVERNIIPVEEIPLPDWVNKTYLADSDYYYGIGMYTAIGLENDAWQTAEEQAIFNILNQVAVNYSKINLLYSDGWTNEDYSEEISVLEIRYGLRDISIVARFPDRDNKLFYVLARIHKNDVIPLFGY
ncbi:MAG: hypothetical protein JW956_09010 [Calditrichaceae bacterium]|nr:hypothetical protein [Calditrichaceae bacterium]